MRSQCGDDVVVTVRDPSKQVWKYLRKGGDGVIAGNHHQI
jgi:hypothetical protein